MGWGGGGGVFSNSRYDDTSPMLDNNISVLVHGVSVYLANLHKGYMLHYK